MISKYKNFLAERIIKSLHKIAIREGRVGRLSYHLSSLLPKESVLIGLDVGCGNGEIAKKIIDGNPDIKILGLDILVQKETAIDIIKFDGHTIPFADKSFAFTMLVDVLYHTKDPKALLEECARVSRNFILIKDHISENWWDKALLSFMDWIGNRGYGVNLVYNYFSEKDWQELFHSTGLKYQREIRKLNLYPPPFSFLFDRNLHFVAVLEF